jgi:hypothetical protein
MIVSAGVVVRRTCRRGARRRHAHAILAATILLLAGGTPATSLAQGPGKRVLPILYLPADQPFAADRLRLQVQAVHDVQEWYATRLGGSTFFADPLIVQRSRHTFAQLADSNFQNWWPLPEKEFAAWGMPWNDSSRIKLLLLAQGAGAWAGADSENGGYEREGDAARVRRGDLGGLAVVGDSSIGGILAGVCPRSGEASHRKPEGGTAWWCNWNTYRGTIAHELGHTFGVPHPDAVRPGFRCDSTVITNMQCHWAWPADSLLPFEAQHFRSTPFFAREARADWTPAMPETGGAAAATRVIGSPAGPDTLLWLTGRGGGTGYLWGVRSDEHGEASMRWQPPPGTRWFIADIGWTGEPTEDATLTFRCDDASTTERLVRGAAPRTITVPLATRCTLSTTISPAAPIGMGNPRWSPRR